jgi:Flp pilus assembly protein TadD
MSEQAQALLDRAYELLWKENRAEEAVVSLREATDLQPDQSRAFEMLGEALNRLGRDEEAIAAYHSALPLDDRNPRLHLELGLLLEAAGRWPEEVAVYREAVRLAPDDSLIHHRLGSALIRAGEIDEGIAEYHEAERLDPYGPTNWSLEMAWDLQRAGKLSGAVTLYRQLTLLHPMDPRPHLLLADALASVGELEDAADEYQKVLHLQPEHLHAYAHHQLGLLMRQQGRVDEAIVQMRRAVELSPGDARAHLDLGDALVEAGRQQEAGEEWRKALAMDDVEAAEKAQQRLTASGAAGSSG